MAKMTVEQQRDELLRTLKELEEALHDGETAEDDGYAVQDVREREGDYLVLLTDLGNIALNAIEAVEKSMKEE